MSVDKKVNLWSYAIGDSVWQVPVKESDTGWCLVKYVTQNGAYLVSDWTWCLVTAEGDGTKWCLER